MSATQSGTTDETLRLLSLFHYIWAGLGILGLAFMALHYTFMSAMMSPEVLARSDNPPPPEFMHFFIWFYVAYAVFGITTMVLNVLAGKWIRARRHWTFCMVVAGINCISMPLGTILGVFTLVLLTKGEVRGTFESPPGAAVE